MLLGWSADKVATIRDFRHAPYVIDGAEYLVASPEISNRPAPELAARARDAFGRDTLRRRVAIGLARFAEARREAGGELNEKGILAGGRSGSGAGAARVAGDTIKIGFVSTFSGPTAVIGNDMRNSFELALDHLGPQDGRQAGRGDLRGRRQKPDVGKQKTEKLIQSDKVDFIAGYIWSNVLLASLKTAVDSQTFLISANAGPSQLAGELCSPLRVLDLLAERPDAAGDGPLHEPEGRQVGVPDRPELRRRQGHAGRREEHVQGRGQVGEEYTVWPSQLDFSAELTKARASKAESIFVFYPGAAGVQFLNQYAQAGIKAQIPLYTAFTIDELSLPLQKENAIGVPGAQQWVNDLPNDREQEVRRGLSQEISRPAPTFTARSPMTPRS
jgi:branched-chain amino acid transport system substrate-binding protein